MREASSQYARIDVAEGELAKAWLVRVIERTSASQLAELPVAWIATEGPPLIGEILRELRDPSSPAALSADARRRARALAGLRPGGAAPGEVAQDVAALQSVLVEALGRGLGGAVPAGGEPRGLAEAAGRLSEIFGRLQSEFVEAIVEQRGAAAPVPGAPLAESQPSEPAAALGQRAGAAVAEPEDAPATDEVTGLPGAGALHGWLGTMVAEYHRYGHPFAVLVIDVDGLDRINEAYGREVGDRMLAAVANAVRRQVRSVDRAFRLNDDEFCVLAPHQIASKLQPLADRLTSSVNAWQHDDAPRMSVTIGIVSCPQHGDDPESLLEVAEETTYAAKASGRRFAVGGNGIESFMQDHERT